MLVILFMFQFATLRDTCSMCVCLKQMQFLRKISVRCRESICLNTILWATCETIYLVQSKCVSFVFLVASLVFINQTKLNSGTYFLLEMLEASSNLAHTLAFGDYSIASLFFMFLSKTTEPIQPQLKSRMIYCHGLQVLLVLKLYLVVSLKDYSN